MTPAEIARQNLVAARASRTEAAQERYERYLQLRRGGYSIKEAAWELGITRRHADRYEKRRQNDQQSAARPGPARPGRAGPGMERPGIGPAGHGMAGRGIARPGVAVQGPARQGRETTGAPDDAGAPHHEGE